MDVGGAVCGRRGVAPQRRPARLAHPPTRRAPPAVRPPHRPTPARTPRSPSRSSRLPSPRSSRSDAENLCGEGPEDVVAGDQLGRAAGVAARRAAGRAARWATTGSGWRSPSSRWRPPNSPGTVAQESSGSMRCRRNRHTSASPRSSAVRSVSTIAYAVGGQVHEKLSDGQRRQTPAHTDVGSVRPRPRLARRSSGRRPGPGRARWRPCRPARARRPRRCAGPRSVQRGPHGRHCGSQHPPSDPHATAALRTDRLLDLALQGGHLGAESVPVDLQLTSSGSRPPVARRLGRSTVVAG